MTEVVKESVFKLRIVNVDYYLCQPIIGFDDNYSEFRESEINKVPIIRIFGTTLKGVKTCLHVHRVYPYLCIPFDYPNFGTNNSTKSSYLRKLVNELEANLMPSRVQTRNQINNDSIIDKQIFSIQEIDAIPFYGFHNSCRKFLKIYFYNPSLVKKASELLLSGAIMDRIIQPFEAHIPYILQFFIDNNLYGMNFIDVKKVHFRKTNELIDNLNYLNVDPISSCEVECDINFEDIINRELQTESKRNPGLEAIWKEEINRCKNSQELLNLNGIPSQERNNIPIFETESYHLERLYQGLSELNITFDDTQNSNSSQLSLDSNSSKLKKIDFAKMIVQCIRDNEDSDDCESDSSISNEMSQQLEQVLTESQKSRSKTRSKNINLRPTHETSSTEEDDSDSTIIDETEFNERVYSYVDAGTQTELRNNLEDSIDSLSSYVDSNDNNNGDEEIEEVLCDCEADECCDQCCDQPSDQCECNCDKCEFEKCKRIPQLDGAYDEDDDESDVNYKHKNDSNDSDFEISKERKKNSPKKTTRKRAPKSRNSNANKRKKSAVNLDSDSSGMEFTNDSSSFTISKPGPASKKKFISAIDSSPSISITSLDQNDNGFEQSSSKRTKKSDRLSSKLYQKLSSNKTKKRRTTSPIHMSFSEASDSDKSEQESSLNFLRIAGLSSMTSYSNSSLKTTSKKSKTKQNFDDNRSERSSTPYLSHESDEEIVPTTRPGPKSSKPGPKSSKAKSSKTSNVSKPDPKSSETSNPKPGPKSSKTTNGAKMGPKSSKMRHSISSQSDLFNDNAITRSRRSKIRNVSYGENEDKFSTSVSSIWSEVNKTKPTSAIPKTKTTPQPKSVKTKSQTTSSSCKSSPKKKSPIKPKIEPNFSVDYESELSWKCFNNNFVQIDLNYFDGKQIESIGFEKLNVKKMADFELDDSLNNYLANIDYWLAEKSQLDLDLRIDQKSGKKSTTTRSKGALKDFYTLPHLNAIKSSEKRTKAQNTRKSNEFARLITRSSNLIGSPEGRISAPNSKNKVKPKPPVRQSSPKRGSSSAKSKANNKRETRSRMNPKLERRVTSSTLFTTSSIHSSSLPFYESDIRVVTDLKGYKKVSFLKSLCEQFEIQTNKLPDHYVEKYKNQNINPFLFNDIYYNDYSGYLSDRESQLKQDVIITMRNVIENVVQVSHCVDSLLNEVQKELEPQPMIDTREDEYFHESNDTTEDSYWDYGHYADDSEYQVQEVGLEERDDGLCVEATNEDMIANRENNPIDDYENETSFADNSQLETKNTESEGFINSYEEQEVERSNDKEVNNSNDCLNNGDNNYDEEENNSENETENEDQNGEQFSQMCESYGIGTQAASEEFSPSSALSEHYSNNNSNQYIEQNSPNDLQNQYQEEEEVDQSNSTSSNCLPHNNIPPNLSNLDITHVPMHSMSSEPEFKTQTTYSSEMFNYNANTNPQSYQQMPNIASVATHIVPPTEPTVVSTHAHYAQQTVYTQQQSWPQIDVMPINGMNYIPNVNNSQNVLNAPQEPEFDVSNFSYMDETYYSNANIPQFDGIFDDDSFQSEFNQFNMNCKPDNNIEQLSQGSRSEEMSQTNNVQRLSTEVLNVESNGLEAMPGNHRNDEIERYFKNINGLVVYIPKSIPDALLQKIGREVLALERLKITLKNDDQYVEDIFSEDDSKKFFKTSLIGKEKFNYLQSLCKDFHININRLNFHNFNDSTLEYYFVNKTRIPVSSFSNQFRLKNKNFCVQNESNSSPLSIIDNEMTQNNSESNNKINDSEDGIYSFYLNETPPNLSQSTVTSIRSLNKSLDKLSGNSYKHHSTPLNHKKCKPLSDILETNDFQLTGLTQESSHQRRKSFEKLKFDDSITSRNRQKLSCDSVIEGPTPSNTFDFEISSASALNNGTPNDNLSDCEHQYLTTMSVEVHVTTRANLNPDPTLDNIEVIFYSISNDSPSDSEMPKSITGLIAVEPDLEAFNCTGYTPAITSKRKLLARSGYGPKDVKIEYATDEVVLLMMFVDIVKQYDPDIIVGYEIDTLSWGYVLQRANVLNVNVLTPLSRIIEDKYCRNTESTANNACHLSGRITMNLWRIMRSEVTLNVYTYENVHYHVLHERIPSYDYSTLTQWYSDSFNHLNRWRVMDYYVTRVKGCLRLLDKLDFITRNSELARLFGIQFSEVFNRGSQFRVESIMLRSAKQFNYLAVSPNPRQVANMKAPESLPLILEPESKYYTDPVAVLDFQSLYPSMMIAYNYCYSTCLGRVDQLINSSNDFEFGCIDLEIQKNLLLKYKNDIHISPNGVVFLKEYIRRGILPKMLEEILNTRIMVKNAIKANNKKKIPNKALHRKLDARQLGLKLISNVTYGYTGANFSGRMPCVEIADAIVSKGRETLERAIELIQSRPEWGAKVIYGDTDSVFVLFAGCSKEEAFKRGQEIAEAVTQINPKPVKLKFEKVYLPSVLQTKKRYVGFKYESLEQTLPKFDAKGIETVRRDTCPAVVKMLEKSLKILFTTNDVNGVQMYLLRQFQKILDGRVSILNDFIFAREYRGKDNYSAKSHVPSMEIAKRRLACDVRSEPKIDERVPYVVVYGPPNQSIFKLVKEPIELIRDPSLRLNAVYYIERVIIPALNRVFQLMGCDVMKWYKEMPRKSTSNRYQYLLGRESKAKTIPQFFNSLHCVVCDANSKGKDLCDDCSETPQDSVINICDKIRDLERKYSALLRICKSCSGSNDNRQECVSIDCPNLFRFHQSKLDYMNVKYLNNILLKF